DVPAVCARLQEIALSVPVVVCTRRFADAVRLAAEVYEFRGLRMVSGPVPARMLLRASSARFRAHVEDGASFISALLKDPAVGSVQAPLDRNVLEIAGDDAEEVSRAILRASERSQVTLLSLSDGGHTPTDQAAPTPTAGGGVA